MSVEDTKTLREVYVSLQEELHPPAGELDCISSGYVTFDDYSYIAKTLKKISDFVLAEEIGQSLTSPVGSQSGGPAWRKMLKKVLSFSIVSKYPSSQSHSPQEVFGTDVKLVQGKFTKNNPVVPIRTSQRGSRYKDENVLTGTDALEDNEPSALENSDVEEDYSGFLKITRDELAEITQHDEVLEMFFELTNSLLPEYVQKQIRVLPPESVLEFLVHKSSTAAPCGPDDLTLEPFEEALLTPNVAQNIRSSNPDDIFNRVEVDRFLKGFEKLVTTTNKVSFKYMERLSQSLPYSIHSRLSNEYFDPSIAIVAPFVGCGMYASREKEFFVPLIERVKRLQATYSFSSSEEILICIAQLSSFLSNMISSFTLSALLFTVERIRHVRLYMKLRRLHKVDPSEPYLKDANGAEISGRGFKDFAKTVCKLYTAHTQRYLERLRRLFPNVFLLGSFANQDESDDELDKPSVLGTLVSILAKLIFLFAGGIGSITADDRRGLVEEVLKGVFSGKGLPHVDVSSLLTDDVALADALHISAINRLTLIERLFNCSNHTNGSNSRGANSEGDQGMTDTEHDTMIATACADLWRVFFQYCGVLPCGSACPESILGWIDHMPLYLIEDEGKTAILRVYSTLANRKTLILKPVMRENVLQSSSILIRKMTQTTPSSDTKESGHTHYDATNMGAVSEIVKPIFATKSRGSEPSEDGQGPRRDFFELCASESTDQFLPTIDITNSIQVRVHNGDLSEVADPSEAKQYAGQQCAILLVQWKKRPDHYTVIRAGDVLGVEMVDKKLDVPIPQINEKRLSVSAANAHDIEKFSPAPASTNAGEKGGKDSRLSLSDTSELFCKDEQATTDRPNPNVRRASSRRSSVEVINPPLDGEKVITSATVSGGLNTQSTYNFQVTHVLRSTRENQQVVLLSLTGTYMTFFNDYIITTLYHYRRAHPPFCIEKTRRYAWTNPQFKCLSPTESVRDGVVSSYADIPYALGWLIGNSIGNGVVFQAPIPPLAFRVLSRSLKYDQSIAQIRPTPFDLNLICEKWTAEALHLVLMNPQAVMLGVGLPPDTPITRKTIHATLDRLVRELIFNIQDSEEHTTFFWEEVARGLRHTSLAKTPLFRHCCARTLRAILCGRVDNARRSFSFKDHFLIAFDDTVAYMPYTKKICKWTLECLETYFNTEEKRLILRFITGRSLLPSKMKSEVIHINFTSLQMQSLDEFSSLSLRLPTSNTCDSTLNIPNYLEILLVSPKSRYASSFLLDGGRKKKLRVVLPSDYQAAWELLTEAELKTLKKEYTTLLATRLLTSVYETNGFTDDLTTPVERVRTAPHRKSTPEENPAQATSVLSQASNNADFPVYLKGFNGIKAGTHPSALQELRSVSILAMMAHVEESMLLTTPLMSQMLSPQMADLPAGAQELPPTSPNARSMQRNDSETSVDKEPEFGFYRLIREAEKQSTDGFDKKLTDRQQYINMIDVDSSEREKERLMKESSMQHGGPPAPPPVAEKPQPPAKAEPPKVQHFHNTAAFEFDLETSDILPSPKAQVAEVLQVGPPPPPPVAPKKPAPSRHKMPESIRRLQEQLSKETEGRKQGEVKVGFTSDVQKKKSVDAQIEQLFPDL